MSVRGLSSPDLDLHAERRIPIASMVVGSISDTMILTDAEEEEEEQEEEEDDEEEMMKKATTGNCFPIK